MTMHAIATGRTRSGKRLLLNSDGKGTTVRRNAWLFHSRHGVLKALRRVRSRTPFFGAMSYVAVTTSFSK